MRNLVLNYCRWIVFGNHVVKYNVGDETHSGWYVNEYGYWKDRIYSTAEVERGVSGNYTVLGHTNEQYDLPYLRNFVHSAYK